MARRTGTDVSPLGVGVPLHTCTNKGPLLTASCMPGTVLLEKPQKWGSSWLRQSLGRTRMEGAGALVGPAAVREASRLPQSYDTRLLLLQ